jgi:hypothetical protein
MPVKSNSFTHLRVLHLICNKETAVVAIEVVVIAKFQTRLRNMCVKYWRLRSVLAAYENVYVASKTVRAHHRTQVR